MSNRPRNRPRKLVSLPLDERQQQRVRDLEGKQIGRINGRPTDACPDCDAAVSFQQVSHNVMTMVVHHDDTCPTYRGMT